MTEADKKLVEELLAEWLGRSPGGVPVYAVGKSPECAQRLADESHRLVTAELAGRVVDYDKFPIVEFIECPTEMPAQLAFETGAQAMKQAFIPILAALQARDDAQCRAIDNMTNQLAQADEDKAILAAKLEAAEIENNRLKEFIANPPRHKFWGAGEKDCPREIKAGNGELHTLKCKACGAENPRNDICHASLNTAP